MLSTPLNLPKWYVRTRNSIAFRTIRLINDHRLAKNSHLLQPPINNYCVYNEGFTVMVSSGDWRTPTQEEMTDRLRVVTGMRLYSRAFQE